MMRDALTWWTDQLLELVPATFARPDPSSAGALLVEPWPTGCRVIRRRGGEETVLGVFPLDDADGAIRDALAGLPDQYHVPVLVRLPATAAMQREVVLPLAAEAGLDRVLAYEMDRLTPFTADETFFTWSVLRRDREGGRLHLMLSLVLKAGLAPVLAVLRSAAMAPAGLEIPLADDDVLRIPLAHERPAAAMRAHRLLMLSGLACGVLALLAIILPFVLQSLAWSRADQRIAELQPRVSAVQALQRRIAGSTAGAELIASERQHLGDTLNVMAALTRVLPDDTYLTDLSLRQGQLTVSGQSAAAARLIQALSADPAFSAPAFSAPVTRIEGQRSDLFSIRAGLTP